MYTCICVCESTYDLSANHNAPEFTSVHRFSFILLDDIKKSPDYYIFLETKSNRLEIKSKSQMFTVNRFPT
ncbi:unnamed protein product [Heterobilharzia americana]|nr:unnamed protein product [Heterobilharzia americana]